MGKEIVVSVITPTFNRIKKLGELYRSLCCQTSDQFEWLVVDDGSNDDTEAVIHDWMEEKKIRIRYISKENGGKHTALNVGIGAITAELTFIVDSDDKLTPNAIETIIRDRNKIKDDKICGMAYLRKTEDGKILTDKLVPVDGLTESYIECRYNRDIKGDMAEVWKTEVLKKYPFPVFPGEKFLSEEIVWMSMAQEYTMVFFNHAIYICEYLEGGLTKDRRKHNWKSPQGCMYRGKLYLQSKLPVRYKVRGMLYYLIYGKAAGFNNRALLSDIDNKLLAAVLFIPAELVYLRWRKCYG